MKETSKIKIFILNRNLLFPKIGFSCGLLKRSCNPHWWPANSIDTNKKFTRAAKVKMNAVLVVDTCPWLRKEILPWICRCRLSFLRACWWLDPFLLACKWARARTRPGKEWPRKGRPASTESRSAEAPLVRHLRTIVLLNKMTDISILYLPSKS